MSPRILLASTLLLASSALAQDVKVDKFTLDNGMTVIFREDRSLPVATINLWYRVGAKEEPPGRSGFAHLFEHLMFMGTERVPGSDFDNIMERGGGSNNASTSLDRTNYFSSGPRELLPTLLWLDADRLEDLGRTMNQEKLDKQRDVVRNERRQTTENAPYGKADDALYQLMYPQGHPYHFAVIGTHSDLEAAQVTDVKDFFATFYVPSNCSLVVAGDFDPAQIKPLVTQLFGTLPRGGQVVNRSLADVPQPVLGKVVRRTMLDKVEQPRVTFCYHSPAWYAEGDAEMDLLSSVLARGKSSRLYKRLVLDEKLATEVSATQDSSVLGSLFRIDVYTPPEADLAKVESIVDEEIARLQTAGVTSEELEQRKSTFELAFLSRMDSLSAVADRLNEYQFIWGEPNSFKRDLDRYRNATPAALQDWSKRILTPASRTILRVLPEQPERDKTPRDAAPAAATGAEFSIAKPETFTVAGSVPAMLWNRPELPLVTLRLLIKPTSGGALVPAPRAGLAHLTAEMLGEGAGSRDAVAFADTLQRLGATFNAAVDQESVIVDMTVLKRNLPAAAELFGDAIIRPRFSDTDFERVHRLHLQDLESQLNEPAIVASRVASRALFGEGHPYSLPAVGTPTTVRPLTLADAKAMHQSLITPDGATLFIAGDITAAEAKSTLDAVFKDWKPASTKFAGAKIDPIAPPQASGLRVFIVDRPEAVQTVIRFAAPGPKQSDPSRVPLRVMNTLLGGSFTSRLNQNLREEKGYTYGAGSAYSMEPSIGSWSARSSVKADVTGPALAEFFKEFSRLSTGDISDQETQKAVKTIRTDVIQSLAGIHGPVTLASDLLAGGLDLSSVTTDLAQSAALSASQLNAIAKSAVNLDAGVLVLVGDKALILEQIKSLSLPSPIELGPDGTPRNGSARSSAE